MNELKGTIRQTPKLRGQINAPIITQGAGENGATFIPAVSEEGVISWTNDKGLVNPSAVDIKGPKGDKGDDFTYEDFTEEQLEALKGADYVLTDADKQEIAEMAAEEVEIPTSLPNPFPLTINGTSYDGRAAVEMTIEGGGGASGGEYTVLVNDTISPTEPIAKIEYTDIDFHQYEDIIIYFEKPANKTENTTTDRKITVKMLGYLVAYKFSVAGSDAHRSTLIVVKNMGNGNVVSFTSTANNQKNNPTNLISSGVYPMNGSYYAPDDNGFVLEFNEAYKAAMKIKIIAK